MGRGDGRGGGFLDRQREKRRMKRAEKVHEIVSSNVFDYADGEASGSA